MSRAAAAYVGDYGTKAIAEMPSVIKEYYNLKLMDYWISKLANV